MKKNGKSNGTKYEPYKKRPFKSGTKQEISDDNVKTSTTLGKLYNQPTITKVEVKSHAGSISSSRLNTTGNLAILNGINNGSTAVQRTGESITIKSLQMKVHIARAASGGENATGKVAIVYDNAPNGQTPAITDIYETIVSYSITNQANRTRFQILKEWIWTIYAENPFWNAEHYIQFKNGVPAQYSGTTDQVSDVLKGALWVVWLGNTSDTAANALFYMQQRIRFTDI